MQNEMGEKLSIFIYLCNFFKDNRGLNLDFSVSMKNESESSQNVNTLTKMMGYTIDYTKLSELE